MNNPEQNLFSDQQWKEITSLVDALNDHQALWLSEYLSGSSQTATTHKAQDKARRSIVGYGTETGNSKALAELFLKTATESGKHVELISLSEVKLRHLEAVDDLFIICSTHGDGDPPEPIEFFYTSLLESKKQLSNLKYAVLALGDSTYEKFCETGKVLDKKLDALGAKRLLTCEECDVDFQEQAEGWIESAVQHLGTVSSNVKTEVKQSEDKSFVVSKQSPLEVEVLENICLTSASRVNAIHHIELSVPKHADLKIRPGDSIGVSPHNSPELVELILSLAGFEGDELVHIAKQTLPLVQALREHCDLTVVSSKFIKQWATISNSDELNELVRQENKEIRTYLKRHQLKDIISQHKSAVDPQTFVSLLRPLQPRLYDVANSVAAGDEELHLTVERYQYQINGKWHIGVASDFLTKLDESETIFVYPQHNKRFHLPINNNVPLILVADGTGIAPFRAFIQEIANNQERQHPIWLIFRERSFKHDFLYQLEWQRAHESGVLTRLDGVFFDDDPSRTLFDAVAENYSLFKGWLEAGAHLYLSGHKFELENFEKSLSTGMHSDPGIKPIWQSLNSEGRIHKNLY